MLQMKDLRRRSALSLYPLNHKQFLSRIKVGATPPLPPIPCEKDNSIEKQGIRKTLSSDIPVSDWDTPVNTFQMRNLNKMIHNKEDICELEPVEMDTVIDVELLEKKCRLCKYICNFSNDEFDKQAQMIKRNTLRELLEYYNTPYVSQLPAEAHQITYDMCCSNIFRTFNNNKLFFQPEELPQCLDPFYSHLDMVYSILLRLLTVSKQVFSLNFHVMFLDVFETQDSREHHLIVKALIQYYVSFKDRQEDLFNKVCSHVDGYVENISTPHAVIPAIKFVSRVFRAIIPAIPPQWIQLVLKHFLPLLRTTHISWFNEDLINIFNCISQIDTQSSIRIFFYIINHWTEKSILAQLTHLEMLNQMLNYMSVTAFSQVYTPLFALYGNCALSTSSRVAELSFKIWLEDKTPAVVVNQSKYVFPLILKGITRASKSHWSQDTKNAALAVLRKLHDLDPFAYGDLHPKCEKMNSMNTLKTQQKWLLVARTAAHEDLELNLIETLAMIQRDFEPEKGQVVMSSCGAVMQKNVKLIVPKRANTTNWR